MRRRGGCRNDVAGLRAGARRAHAPDIQRRQIQQLHQLLAAALGAAQPQLAHQVAIHVRRFGHGAAFGLAQRLDAIVEMIDGDAAVIVLHRRQQPRQHHRRIGRPVSVVAAVQLALRPIDGDIELGDAARAEHDLLRRLWCTGPSQISQTSLASRSLYFARMLARCGDPASSSPSKTNLMLARSGMPARAAHRAPWRWR
jgi:hypothetical protein